MGLAKKILRASRAEPKLNTYYDYFRNYIINTAPPPDRKNIWWSTSLVSVPSWTIYMRSR